LLVLHRVSGKKEQTMEHNHTQPTPSTSVRDAPDPDEHNPIFTTETFDTESFARGMLEAQTDTAQTRIETQ
jgi:hypothetical protein